MTNDLFTTVLSKYYIAVHLQNNGRKVSTRINLGMSGELTRTYTFRLLWIFLFRESLLYTSIPLRRNLTAHADLSRYITQSP